MDNIAILKLYNSSYSLLNYIHLFYLLPELNMIAILSSFASRKEEFIKRSLVGKNNFNALCTIQWEE